MNGMFASVFSVFRGVFILLLMVSMYNNIWLYQSLKVLDMLGMCFVF
jgi:hypothetical protein